MQARAKILFFLPLEVEQVSGTQSHCFKAPAQGKTNTLSVTHHSVRIQHDPQSGGKGMQQARFPQDARCIFAFKLSSRCSRRLFVTFNIAAIVCDDSNTPLERGEKEWECRWEENSQWLMVSGIKRPQLHQWTIHYCEVDILQCQPMVTIWMRAGDMGYRYRPVGLEETRPVWNIIQNLNEWENR